MTSLNATEPLLVGAIQILAARSLISFQASAMRSSMLSVTILPGPILRDPPGTLKHRLWYDFRSSLEY
ncbi:hypothetical protein [Nitrosomonas sp.]|uniref:hypothetical protein n=1 Tax=Nitrosomonas sp. TaxID=42353 RepID=UPI0025FDEAAD|nr:hypothetical protein [Nitrosomonas sp.]MBY0484059.1 hypothetical protein [Nitrosomonas sp.]